MQRLRVDGTQPSQKVLGRAAEIVTSGGIVVLPTETVYGVATDAFNETACEHIYTAKGRPRNNPLPVFVAAPHEIDRVVRRVPALARPLMERFWPGPLTLVMPAHPDLPLVVTGATGTVGVRIPDHPVPLGLARLADTPLACTSANRSGQPSVAQADDIDAGFLNRVDLVLDGGPCTIGVASTVLDLSDDAPRLVREGTLTADCIEQVIGARVAR